jgi:hypothetical protein
MRRRSAGRPLPPRLGARLEGDLRSLVQFRGRPADIGAATDVDAGETAFGSALLDAEIRFRAPISVADMLRSAIFARRAAHEPVWRGLQRLL